MTAGFVIATFNRAHFVGRALKSIQSGHGWCDRVVVVDDGSDDDTQMVVSDYPCAYVRLDVRRGPCVARNVGLRMLNCGLALMLDSDDELVPGAVEAICSRVQSCSQRYPVYFFHTNTTTLLKPVSLLNLENLISQVVRFDVAAVIDVEYFLRAGLQYPDTGAGGEHLLWYQVAKSFGIPIFNNIVIRVNHDAPHRLTSPAEQMYRSREMARIQDLTIEQFGNSIKAVSRQEYLKRVSASCIYWTLSKESHLARARATHVLVESPLLGVALWTFSFLPAWLAKRLFYMYKGGVR